MKTLYICHYCIDYKTDSLSDMIRHYKRKTKCQCNTMFNYEDCIYLSRKKFTFNKDVNIDNLVKSDYLYIITHYLDNENIINKNFINQNNIYNKNNNIKNNIDNNTGNNNININNNNIDNNNIDNNNTGNNSTKIDNNSNIIENDDIVLYKPDSKTKITKHFNNIYYNKKTRMYICGNCESEYTYLHNLKRHLEKNTCVKRVEKIQILDEVNKGLINIIKKENQTINNTYIGTQNNNIQNNNNPQNNTYNFNMKDFAHDHYDISHIKDDFYSKKDFFLYPIFLDAIMQNKNNHNIFINDNEAIIYTDNELNKMNSDKAGYMVLDKLSQSVDQLIYKNDKETQNYYAFVQKYYHVIKGHYKHDTIYKEYDVDERQFIYTSNSRSFRSRDKYLAKISGTLSRYKNSARENMNITINEIKDIPMVNPNIEDFCSVRNRYKDLKDKNAF